MAAIKQTMQNTLNSDLVVRPEFLGLQALLAPFIQHSSCQRNMMWGSHSAQAMVIDGADMPRVMTGYEKMIGESEFTKCRVDQDIIIRRVIPKFNPSAFKDSPLDCIPSWTVIYSGVKDGMIHAMDVSTYTYLHDGFGYFNKMLCMEEDRLYPGNVVPKGTKLTTSPSHDDTRWTMGTNGNVVYMGEWGSTEDACVISRSLAERGTNTAILQTKLTIGVDDIPLGLYSDGENYKCFPGIGEQVNKEGILIALRRNNESTFVSDMVPSRLREIEIVHDELQKAPPGATVIDVDVYINRDALRKMKDRDDSIYKQFLDFHKAHGKLATLTAVMLDQSKGVLNIGGDNAVRSFREKSAKDSAPINAGYMVLEPQVFDYLTDDSCVFEQQPLMTLAKEGQLMSYQHKGFWQCMDTKREMDDLEKMWKSGTAPWKVW